MSLPKEVLKDSHKTTMQEGGTLDDALRIISHQDLMITALRDEVEFLRSFLMRKG